MEQIKEAVNNKLLKLCIGEEIDKRTYGYLIAIEEVLIESEARKKEAIEIIKEERLNTKKISERVSISRATIYNNPILLRYIEDSIESEKEDLFKEIETLKEIISNQKITINNMMKRDAELVLYKNEVEKLREQIEILQSNLDAEIMRAEMIRKNKGTSWR